MVVSSYSNTRANLKEVMDRCIEDHTPTLITRQSGGPVVMVSLEDWNAMQETNYLRSNPNNHRRLLAAMKRMDAGKGVERELIRP